MRGQATSTRPTTRQGQSPRTIIDPSRHRLFSRSGSIFSSQCRQNRHTANRPVQTFIFFQDKEFGGAERDRTADLRSAIAALSQLSYGPNSKGTGKPITNRKHQGNPSRKKRNRSRSHPSPPILVELSGIEPLTPCLQSRCSPS